MKTAEAFSLEHTVSSNLLSGLIPLNEVPRRLPRRNGKRLHISTVYRWTCKKGVYLEHWRIGRSIYTTEDALMKFFRDMADAVGQQTTTAVSTRKPRRRASSSARQREIDEANSILIKAGILADTDDFRGERR